MGINVSTQRPLPTPPCKGCGEDSTVFCYPCREWFCAVHAGTHSGPQCYFGAAAGLHLMNASLAARVWAAVESAIFSKGNQRMVRGGQADGRGED